MEIYKKNFGVFLRHKLFAIAIPAYTLYQIAIIITEYLEIYGQGYPVLEYTRRILMLIPQIFVLYLIITYEYFSEANRNNIEETIEATGRSYSNSHKRAMFMVMFSVLFGNYMAFALFDVFFTKYDLFLINVQDAGDQGLIFILSCLFVNVFLIGSIAILLGALIAKIKRRITAYATIMAVVFLTSYLLSRVATLLQILTDYSVNLFEFLKIFDIMPKGLIFTINSAFGFSLVPSRVCLILFWNALLLSCLIMLYSKRKKALKIILCLVACIVTLWVHSLPASDIDMTLNSKGSAMADQHYYEIAEYRMKEEAPDFSVKRYKMELDTRRLLKAKVSMTVTEPLEEYKFTFSHSYRISDVHDQNGTPLQYQHYKDELTIYAADKDITEITIQYEGANEAFYTNIQGINLPGGFPYYPVPGRKRITEDGFNMNSLLLKEKAEFDLKIKSGKKVYTNLEEIEKNHYAGSSTGLSIFSGLYTEYHDKGISIVYPYLEGWRQSNLDAVADVVKELGYTECKVLVSPNMNRRFYTIGEDQIVSTGYFESVDDLQ